MTCEDYRKLQREQKKLKRQIDWQALDDEPDVEDSTRTLDDPKYRPDDPPLRTTETWADYLKKESPPHMSYPRRQGWLRTYRTSQHSK